MPVVCTEIDYYSETDSQTDRLVTNGLQQGIEL